jgi:hypothetical protein
VQGLGKGLLRGKFAQQGRVKGRTAVTTAETHESTQGRHLQRTAHVSESGVRIYECRWTTLD